MELIEQQVRNHPVLGKQIDHFFSKYVKAGRSEKIINDMKVAFTLGLLVQYKMELEKTLASSLPNGEIFDFLKEENLISKNQFPDDFAAKDFIKNLQNNSK